MFCDKEYIMNNQDTMNENKEQETKTRVLSDTERRDFDGVTIDEEGDTVQVEFTPTQKEEEQSGYEQFQDYGPRVKVYHFGGSSWLSRIIMIIVLVAILAAIVFFGGIILSIVGVVILVGAIISFILGLF